MALVGGAFAICFFLKRLIESIINISVSLKKENYYDTTKQHQRMVFNKKTKKLEADNSIILPFD